MMTKSSLRRVGMPFTVGPRPVQSTALLLAAAVGGIDDHGAAPQHSGMPLGVGCPTSGFSSLGARDFGTTAAPGITPWTAPTTRWVNCTPTARPAGCAGGWWLPGGTPDVVDAGPVWRDPLERASLRVEDETVTLGC